MIESNLYCSTIARISIKVSFEISSSLLRMYSLYLTKVSADVVKSRVALQNGRVSSRDRFRLQRRGIKDKLGRMATRIWHPNRQQETAAYILDN